MVKKFWMVWSPRGGKARRKHSTLLAAQAEALRLAERHNGRHFYVLEMLDAVIIGPEQPTARQAEQAKAVADGR